MLKWHILDLRACFGLQLGLVGPQPTSQCDDPVWSQQTHGCVHRLIYCRSPATYWHDEVPVGCQNPQVTLCRLIGGIRLAFLLHRLDFKKKFFLNNDISMLRLKWVLDFANGLSCQMRLHYDKVWLYLMFPSLYICSALSFYVRGACRSFYKFKNICQYSVNPILTSHYLWVAL